LSLVRENADLPKLTEFVENNTEIKGHVFGFLNAKSI